MKKRKSKQQIVWILPNASALTQAGRSVQYYRGDFFSIQLAKPASHTPLLERSIRYLHPDASIDFMFDEQTVEEYRAYCPLLAETRDWAALVPFWSLGMESAALNFLDCSLTGYLADRFLYARTIDLLLEFIRQANYIRSLPSMDPRQVAIAERARALILEDLSVHDTVEEIARKCHTAEADLQAAFKNRFATTVGAYSKQVRMEYAHRLLSTTNMTLLAIGLEVGYNDPGNFSVAFKNYFGYSPGTVQRNGAGNRDRFR